MKRFTLIAILILMGGLFLESNARALTVAPVRLEVSGDPGRVTQTEVTLFNELSEQKTFYSSFENFEARGETGSPYFIPGEEGLAGWISAPSQVTLEAGERKDIPVSIHVPSDTDPGGHFAGIFWGTTPPDIIGSGEVAVGAKIGILVLLSVSGDIQEGGDVLEFSTENGQRVFTSLPITFTYRFQNTGDDRVNPKGNVEIRNLVGGTTTALDANPTEGNILPRSIRKFSVIWKGESDINQNETAGFLDSVKNEWTNFAFGRYTANLDIVYGKEAKEAQSNWSFFIFPWHLLSLIILAIVFVGFIGIKGVKGYNRWIISHVTQQLKDKDQK